MLMLKDSLAHVDTATLRCFKPPQPPEDMQTTHVYTEWDVTDKLTLIWTCSGFLDMTSYYCEMWGWPWGQRAGSAPSGRHEDLAEGATSFGQGENSLPSLSCGVPFTILKPKSPDHCVTVVLFQPLSPRIPSQRRRFSLPTLLMQMGGVAILRQKFQIHRWRHFNPLLFGLKMLFFSFQSACQLRSAPPLCPTVLPSEQHEAR